MTSNYHEIARFCHRLSETGTTRISAISVASPRNNRENSTNSDDQALTKMDEDSDELTAYHEAGHAVMALLTGGQVQHVTITPDRDDGPARFGDASIRWPRRGLGERELALAMIRVALAGPVVEMIYTGEPYHPGLVAQWAEDWRSAWSTASSLESNEVKRLRLLELETKYLVQQFQDDCIWAAVAELADNLLAHEWLDAEQVGEIISAHF